MESQQDSVVADVSRVSPAVAEGYGETFDSFDSELHLVSVENMLSLGELIHAECVISNCCAFSHRNCMKWTHIEMNVFEAVNV
jgi:hypothetical protein